MSRTTQTLTDYSRRPGRRSLSVAAMLVVAFAVAWTAIWSLSTAIVDSEVGNPHGGSELERPDPAAVTADVQGVADLHAHLNYALWGGGDFERADFMATGERTLELIDDPAAASSVNDALDSARIGELMTAHDQIERAEDRLAERNR